MTGLLAPRRLPAVAKLRLELPFRRLGGQEAADAPDRIAARVARTCSALPTPHGLCLAFGQRFLGGSPENSSGPRSRGRCRRHRAPASSRCRRARRPSNIAGITRSMRPRSANARFRLGVGWWRRRPRRCHSLISCSPWRNSSSSTASFGQASATATRSTRLSWAARRPPKRFSRTGCLRETICCKSRASCARTRCRSWSRAASRLSLPSSNALIPIGRITRSTCIRIERLIGSSSSSGHDKISRQRSRPIMLDLRCCREMPPPARKIRDARHVWEGDNAAVVVADAELALSLQRSAVHWPSM
jgi:hypothetical protein